MFAVIKSGGKQHRVQKGETLKLEGEGKDVKIGSPRVKGSKVTGEVVSHGKGDKVTIVKFRRRKHSRSTQGHRQWYTEVKITSIRASAPKRKD